MLGNWISTCKKNDIKAITYIKSEKQLKMYEIPQYMIRNLEASRKETIYINANIHNKYFFKIWLKKHRWGKYKQKGLHKTKKVSAQLREQEGKVKRWSSEWEREVYAKHCSCDVRSWYPNNLKATNQWFKITGAR